jgi:hypothetical protein
VAEFLATGGFAEPGSVAAYLRDALPDDYTVVADPIVCRCPVDAVVVGPAGLTVLQAGAGESRQGAARAPGAAVQARKAQDAVRTFMRDEFPALAPAIRYVRAARDPDAQLLLWRAVEATGAREEPLAETITTESSGDGSGWADEATRETVAVALRDRQLTASVRTVKPFVFRSGAKAWSIRDAVHHMDRRPSDGIYHLRNGTLATWLREEGAPHLAKLAQESVLQTTTDARVALETFLIGTGLVARPRLAFRPAVVDLGYILDGDSAARVLRLRRGRGRGYLFGELTTSDAWLHVEPLTFIRGPVEAVVSAQSEPLSISAEPYHAVVLIHSSAGEGPAEVPVRLRVVAYPLAIVRIILRPLLGLLVAGAAGGAIGWLWGAAAIPMPGPRSVTDLLTFGNFVSPWIAVLGAFWAIFGLIRGIFQPRAWPTAYALGRWLARAAGWGLVLAAIAVALTWCWRVGLGAGATLHDRAYAWAALFGVAISILPSALTETVTAQQAADPRIVKGRRSRRRLALLGIAAVAIVLFLLLAPRTISPALQRLEAQGTFTSAQDWVQNSWNRVNEAANGLLDRLYLGYYDRRAPLKPTPAPSPTRKPASTAISPSK